MAEEVKQQFAEAVPGGIALFTKALGMTEPQFFKAMENGTLLAKDTLPKLAKQMAANAREGNALGEALNSSVVAGGRLRNAWQEMTAAIFRSGFDQALGKVYNALANLVEVLTPVAVFITSVLSRAFDMVAYPLRILSQLLQWFVSLFGPIHENEMAKFLGTVLGLVAGFRGLAFVLTMIVGSFKQIMAMGIIGFLGKVIKQLMAIEILSSLSDIFLGGGKSKDKGSKGGKGGGSGKGSGKGSSGRTTFGKIVDVFASAGIGDSIKNALSRIFSVDLIKNFFSKIFGGSVLKSLITRILPLLGVFLTSVPGLVVAAIAGTAALGYGAYKMYNNSNKTPAQALYGGEASKAPQMFGVTVVNNLDGVIAESFVRDVIVTSQRQTIATMNYQGVR